MIGRKVKFLKDCSFRFHLFQFIYVYRIVQWHDISLESEQNIVEDLLEKFRKIIENCTETYPTIHTAHRIQRYSNSFACNQSIVSYGNVR